MTILLDTSVIIDALNHKHGRHKLLLQLAQDGCTLACCAVNMGEVYAGMRREEHNV